MFIKCVLEFAFCKGKGSAFCKPTITGDIETDVDHLSVSSKLRTCQFLPVYQRVAMVHMLSGETYSFQRFGPNLLAGMLNDRSSAAKKKRSSSQLCGPWLVIQAPCVLAGEEKHSAFSKGMDFRIDSGRNHPEIATQK